MTNPQDPGTFDYWISDQVIVDLGRMKSEWSTGDYNAWLQQELYWDVYAEREGGSSMSAITRKEIKIRLARYFGYAKGTASGGSTTTIVGATSSSYRLEPDDYFNNWYALIGEDAGGADAAPQGEERRVSDYANSTATLTVSPAFSAAVANGDVYHLCTESWALMEEALEESCFFAWPYWYKEVRDTTTLDTTTNQFYSLPSDSARLVSVSWLSSDGYTRTPLNYWIDYGTPGNMVLYTEEAQSAGYNIEIVYLQRPMFVTSTNTVVTDPADTDYLNISYGTSAEDHAWVITCANYMIYYAAMLMYQWRIGQGSEGDSRDSLTKMKFFEEHMMDQRTRPTRMPPKTGPLTQRPWRGRKTRFGS